MTAFEKWLISRPREEAIEHFIDCLKSGGEMAWGIMEQHHGDWKCAPKDLPKLIKLTLDQIEKRQSERP